MTAAAVRLIVAALFLGVFLGAATAAHAGGSAETDESAEPPEDERSSYVVGFQAFEAEEVSSEHRSLAVTLPRLLRQELSVLDEHELSREERDAFAGRLLERARAEAGAALDEAVEERAALRFETGRADERRRAVRDADEAVSRARSELRAVEALKPDQVEVPGVKPLELVPEDGEDPFDSERLPRRLARDEDLDVTVGGRLLEVDGTIVAEVEVYHRYLERVVARKKVTGEPGRTDELIGSVADGIAEVLLGRPWGRLTVSVPASEAAVYLNERLLGFGEVQVDYARTGSREVRVSLDGVSEQRRTVQVEPGETTEVEVVLPAMAGEQVRIESDPPGAAAYLGSVWQGVTPLTLEKPATPQTMILSLEGFLDETVVLSPRAPDDVRRELVPDPGDWPEVVTERRDRFYRAFGWFALSIPIPVMLNGMYQDIAALYPGGQPSPELSEAEAERLATTGNTLLWSARGTAAVSAGLFVNMMVRLIQYVRAGEYAHD
ncbi:MAG: PEGA domain-containing protein [Spirochaetaceae bacterium]